MANASITTEQRERLEKFVAGIGHNQGPALDAHVESISKHVAQLHGLRAEATRIRVILDLMRSHLAGEYLLSREATATVFGLVAILATISAGPAMVTMPVPAILLDVVLPFSLRHFGER